jgi:polysaccharide biosynthesis/export protein
MGADTLLSQLHFTRIARTAVSAALLCASAACLSSNARAQADTASAASAAASSAGRKALAAQARLTPDDYQIGPGDILQIAVWREPDASIPSVVVRPDGKITVPLLKQIEVAGLTPTQAEAMIADKLKSLINDPDVTVLVTAINSKKVYVMGGVRREGPLAYSYRMNVLQAITEAGGLSDYAKRSKIYVMRTENGKQIRLPFNYNDVVRGRKQEQNITLQPGDTLIVPY